MKKENSLSLALIYITFSFKILLNLIYIDNGIKLSPDQELS